MFQQRWQAPFAPGVLPSQSVYAMCSGYLLETLQTESWVLNVSLVSGSISRHVILYFVNKFHMITDSVNL